MGTETSDFIHRYLGPTSGNPAVKKTTLLVLHGTGGDENDMIPLAQALLPGAGIISPRGNVLENGAPRFFRRLAAGVLDQDDLAFRTGELASFVESAIDGYRLTGNQIIAVGFSNGANIAVSMLFRNPGLLRGAILLSPLLPFEPEVLPDLAGTSVFIGAGRLDPLVYSGQIERLAELMTSAGADVQLHWENAGHTITQDELVAAQSWLGEVIQ